MLAQEDRQLGHFEINHMWERLMVKYFAVFEYGKVNLLPQNG